MGPFITDIDILAPYERPPKKPTLHVPTGWGLIDFNLNSGAGGAYLYFVFEKHAQDRPITGLLVLKDDERPPAGYQKLPVDLNKDTDKHTTALFLAVTRVPGTPITDLDVVHWKSGEQPIPPKGGYLRVQADGADADLNLGAAGDYIFLDHRPATTPQETV
ncbi:hypothetical protein ACIQF6_19920 [Kitasatospora sp. NPDC092948]|uniref:hypothetical protein n=1 Tax=Kitasatospora sp. NPDC092948 TaxID=3364088 RepID=UPI00382491E7